METYRFFLCSELRFFVSFNNLARIDIYYISCYFALDLEINLRKQEIFIDL